MPPVESFRPGSLQTWHIHIKGQVQGVGFRPFVYRLAHEHRLSGWVNNTVDGVHVEINAAETEARQFCESLIREAPSLSVISGWEISKTELQDYSGFRIIHSDSGGETNLLLTPDFAMCPDCRSEVRDRNNRRFLYPFTTCTHCGPRYSITLDLPYDRETTSMDPFPMCPECLQEYNDPTNRRYYSQTNSCPVCPVRLDLYGPEGKLPVKDPVRMMEEVVSQWRSGAIVAIKGIGGYLLTCDATHSVAIDRLRKRKHRPTKPFALMYPGLELLSSDVEISDEEKMALTGIEAPIVLLQLKKRTGSSLFREGIAPGLDQIGAMLPYTPLYEILLKKSGGPIVATSGNISHAPIVYDDTKARGELFRIADLILTNNRDIVLPQDDSVLRFTPFSGQKIILRRSRGMAPGYLNAKLDYPARTVLATGAMMKSSFTFLHRKNTFISQYLGDLEHFDTQENYRHTIRHFFRLFREKPELILSDLHPGYASTQYGESLSRSLEVPFRQYQHHIAHFAAILGEHHLIHTKEPVMGIVWDGTGLGDDRQIWGGEVFLYEKYHFQRLSHFDYFPFILGDKMPREPRISALAASWGLEGAGALLEDKFTETEWNIYRNMLQKGARLKTSSLGRIFDAVASLLGIMDRSSYEGEAAMLLEQEAARYCKEHGLEFDASYFEKETALLPIPTRTLMKEIIDDAGQGKPAGYIAAKFHYSLANLVKTLAGQAGVRKIAFSGGVFQNSLLTDLIIHGMGKEYDLLFHRELSPNDENVSFGQLMCYMIEKEGET